MGKGRGALIQEMVVLKACREKELGITNLFRATNINATHLLQVTQNLSDKGFLLIQEKSFRVKHCSANGKIIPKRALSDNPHRKKRKSFLTIEKGKIVLDLFEQFMKIYEDSNPISAMSVAINVC